MKRINAVATSLALAMAPMTIGTGLATADQLTWPAGSGNAIDVVVQRALSQRGVPYVYGGGDVSGPTNGIRPGSPGSNATFPSALPGRVAVPGLAPAPGTIAGAAPALPGSTVGFDSSGLIQYAFAGAGLKMPRTSGEQCNVGRKVAPAEARRGDLICYGPGGSQSVALFLGNGQMIEGTEPVVTVSAARTSNMMPYLTRIIES